MAAVTGAVIAGAAVANAAYQGHKGRKTAKEAAKMQAQSAADAQAGISSREETFRSDLAPYRQAGESALPLLTEFNTNPQAQMDYLQGNPLFQASLNTADRATAARLASQGRIGTGDQSAQLQENYLLAASPLLAQREQQLLNLANIGQSSAAQVGANSQRAGEAIGEYGTQAANARAAGLIGAQQATANQNAQIIQALPAIFGAFGGGDSTAAGGQQVGMVSQQSNQRYA
jgi:hypothetical protein